ncbi:MAG: bifunctional phosphopantothenoylcysteine decarboxylase/phosphopantothenate--cysteine ligase CoaBC [Euryarchaeota archaeon]|jgi:phosphopantothenoylcysteine decarboxylase/phosphopantothenate--cysteine ligase|nr:bifunctional phosphopantothenoylcysteine decarboxylase/phosphopantothenate--cysteine ligase CoaBC [Euryarchaeota archaeon]
MSETQDIDVEVSSDALFNKRILVGISGGIAVVDSVRVLRELRRHGAIPIVIMTHSAQEIISPLAIEWASQSEVITDWDSDMTQLSNVDAVLVCPATRHTISSHVHGIMDTPLQMALSASRGRNTPILFVPSMHGSLSQDPVTSDLCSNLEKQGHDVLWGASQEGRKKQPDASEIIAELCHIVNSKLPDRKRIVITLGSTRSKIDAVRWIQNTSSGKTGFEIAEYLYRMGHEVTICSGVTTHPSPSANIPTIFRPEPEEMLSALMEISQKEAKTDCWIHAAAVLDYVVGEPISEKTKSGLDGINVKLINSSKHIEALSQTCANSIRIGFKLESGISDEQLIEAASDSLATYGLDAVVANHLESLEISGARAFWVTSATQSIELNDNYAIAKIIDARLSQ